MLGAAAFGRLCVETRHGLVSGFLMSWQPPSGGCVLKLHQNLLSANRAVAAAFGRLCVETRAQEKARQFSERSRLRAAVC